MKFGLLISVIAVSLAFPCPAEDKANVGHRIDGANQVDVVLTDSKITMPWNLPPGPTAFVVVNRGMKAHSFRVVGVDLEKELPQALEPGETRTLKMELKPGEFSVSGPLDGGAGEPTTRKLIVGE